MRTWLARLGFAFLVLAFVLAWEGYRASTGKVPGAGQSRAVLCYTSAAVLFVLGLAGIRERHRPQ
jgi:hypothetical protein